MSSSIPAPIHSMFPEVAAWLAQRGAEGLTPDLRYSAVFSEQSLAPGTQELDELWETGGWISWLGGPAVDPGHWPCNAGGRPLAHVATFHLGGVDALHVESRRAWPQEQIQEVLPTEGVLQVFHDLQTYGYELEDGQARGWLVQWLPDPEQDSSRPPLVRPPEDVEVPSEVCQPGLFMPGFTLPSSLEHRDDQAHSFEHHEVLVEELAGSWQVQRGLEPTPGWTIPFTHVYGHSSSGSAVPLDEVLPEALPLEGEDEHRLVLEIESWTTLNGWFGDASSLEVWMRASDLAQRRFDHAWCMIRTD